MLQSIITYFFGSKPDDFNQAADTSPFEPCPDSPNCTFDSVEFNEKAEDLFEIVSSAINRIEPYEINTNSQSLQIDAVFRIPIFGFKDDVEIAVKPVDHEKSILHIKSSSRVGESDLGVNRRRIKRILTTIKQQIS
ncbi:DUF1499 domain-containing protein [Rhodohalobacter sulfatireducens]|uniref:DUF1499 domain-containing protein n=1 Tax=Rhodohalobacter sulfatireducens TaxID=2911366 RepID=A0ABS9KDW9_9BACT|nr:DUF1499 domain-containing protein [Rhodohalobacter sulfatireducens]MCG2589020.1 DUF1499 domain-containing protein [Rhodohalobacter sulfatireducens]MDR9365190.1 DUF1499 domain-containing protein [Balneolaceae bacterium]MDR9410799.1 DUF1499 domain-containing protein [Balneolaceae bacterium]